MILKLLDIIYCDSKRIENYLTQIQLRKFLNKFPNWLSEVQIPGVAKIGLKNYLRIGERSDFEKSFELIKFLTDTNTLGIGRPNKQGKYTPDFYFESCTATRMFFKHSCYPNLGFSYWISEYEQSQLENINKYIPFNFKSEKYSREEEDYGEPGKLFLLENFEQQDKTYLKRMSSPNSLLWALEYNKLLEREFSQVQAKELAKNPIYALEQIGFKTTLERKVTVLYKIRNLFPENFASGYQFMTIGYPIVIFDKELELKDILKL